MSLQAHQNAIYINNYCTETEIISITTVQANFLSAFIQLVCMYVRLDFYNAILPPSVYSIDLKFCKHLFLVTIFI